MIHHNDISAVALMKQIKHKTICFGGNRRLKIYGKSQKTRVPTLRALNEKRT